MKRLSWIALIIAGIGCGSSGSDGADPGFETGPCVEGNCFDELMCLSDVCVNPSGSASSGNASGSTTTTGTGTTTSATTTAGETGAGTGPGPVCIDPGGPPQPGDCDTWAQDCPAGEKCNPWANNSTAWDATRCVPVAAVPRTLGQACVIEGIGTSGVDDCDVGLFCLPGASPPTLGTCIALCGCNETSPICPAQTVCMSLNDDVLPLCLTQCDPVQQDCGPQRGCYPSAGQFACFAEGSIAEGQGCTGANLCQPGLACRAGNTLPSCNDAACCTPFCDTTVGGCPAGTQCNAWFDPGRAPPGLDEVGVCTL